MRAVTQNNRRTGRRRTQRTVAAARRQRVNLQRALTNRGCTRIGVRRLVQIHRAGAILGQCTRTGDHARLRNVPRTAEGGQITAVGHAAAQGQRARRRVIALPAAPKVTAPAKLLAPITLSSVPPLSVTASAAL